MKLSNSAGPIQRIVFATGFCLLLIDRSEAAIVITEVNSNGSDAAYAADWFELTNNGGAAENISGWRFDDNSNLFANSVALTGVTSINPGQSAIFVEGTAATATNFINTWFGGTAPAGFAIGTYTGGGISLSSGGDAVNIYNGGGTLMANVTFGAKVLGATFDNTAGLTGAISTLSAVGVNGAFVAGPETGSPGAVPEPACVALLLMGAGGMAVSRVRHRSRD
jgi:hypothetical protein